MNLKNSTRTQASNPICQYGCTHDFWLEGRLYLPFLELLPLDIPEEGVVLDGLLSSMGLRKRAVRLIPVLFITKRCAMLHIRALHCKRTTKIMVSYTRLNLNLIMTHKKIDPDLYTDSNLSSLKLKLMTVNPFVVSKGH